MIKTANLIQMLTLPSVPLLTTYKRTCTQTGRIIIQPHFHLFSHFYFNSVTHRVGMNVFGAFYRIHYHCTASHQIINFQVAPDQSECPIVILIMYCSCQTGFWPLAHEALQLVCLIL